MHPDAASRLLSSRDARLALTLLFLVTLFRLWFSTRLELVGDEAYYWLWSRHLDYCYLDKGPMIAWAIRAGTLLFGSTVFGVRFFAVLAAAGTGWGIFLLARRLFDDRTALWALCLALVVPLFAVGATLMTIDTLHVLFWTWAAYAFWRARDSERLFPWVLTGVLIGAGILSKYTALAELFSFALFCAWNPADRRHLRRPGFWLMVGVALLFLLPAYVWNVQHQLAHHPLAATTRRAGSILARQTVGSPDLLRRAGGGRLAAALPRVGGRRRLAPHRDGSAHPRGPLLPSRSSCLCSCSTSF